MQQSASLDADCEDEKLDSTSLDGAVVLDGRTGATYRKDALPPLGKRLSEILRKVILGIEPGPREGAFVLLAATTLPAQIALPFRCDRSRTCNGAAALLAVQTRMRPWRLRSRPAIARRLRHHDLGHEPAAPPVVLHGASRCALHQAGRGSRALCHPRSLPV